MLTFRELAKSLSALLALSAVSACDGWPPRSDDLVTHIKEHKGQIETLVSEFRNSEFGRITCHLCTWEDVEVDDFTVSRKFVDGLWRSVENPRGQYFAELLKAAGVGGVYKRSGGEIELSIAVSARVDDRHYVIQIFHDQQQRDDGFKECIGEFKKIDCGWCKVTVDENLWIQYGWWPKDPDPEATRAHDNGEISWEEWKQKKEEALETCETQGLLEQGYHPPNGE